MPKLKLTYFDFDGGRGEPVRLTLVLGNVPFEDDRVSFDQFRSVQSQMPFGALPVLFVDGVPVAQSNAICRYVGKMTDLYPSDPWQAALCDEVLDTVEEVNVHIGATIQLSDEDKKSQRLKLVAEVLPVFLAGLEKKLKAAGGEYFSNQRLTVADLKSSDTVRWLASGMLDHIPPDFVEKVAPTLSRQAENIRNDPRIVAYYESRKKTK
jgi:prostaglandin-H2 D-isomerase / glutathione transferase